MQFELTEEQAMIQETARRFKAEEIAPTLVEEERKHEFKKERVAKMGTLGFFTCALPEEFGGSGMGFMESVLMAEQISRVSASWRLPFNMQGCRLSKGPRTCRRSSSPEWRAALRPTGTNHSRALAAPVPLDGLRLEDLRS